MDLTCDKQDKAFVVKIKGSMDAVSAPDFEKACGGWIDGGENTLVIDLAELEYISSAGLRSILVTAKKLKAIKGQIAFCNPSKMVERVFSISGFSSLFPMCSSLEEAISRL
ncbi:MAG: anti-sigma factor antagonist [Desulfobacteraceae bacterium]|nr:MAG: anti-sigma factor antagonist [Desulfobacteraceae bacterium]